MWPAQPAARLSSRSPAIARALSATMGIEWNASSALSCLVNVSPSMPGSWMSIRIRSGRSRCMLSRASSAEPATLTWWPAASSVYWINIWLAALSSTTRIVTLSDGAPFTARSGSDQLVQPADELRPRHRLALEHSRDEAVELLLVLLRQLLGREHHDRDGACR